MHGLGDYASCAANCDQQYGQATNPDPAAYASCLNVCDCGSAICLVPGTSTPMSWWWYVLIGGLAYGAIAWGIHEHKKATKRK